MGAKPTKVDTDEAIQDLNHRLSIMSMNKRMANNAIKGREASSLTSEATVVRNDTHDVYERISMGIARTQTVEDDDTIRGHQGPPSPTVPKPVEITVIEIPASPTEPENLTATTKSKGSLKAEDAKSSTISFGGLTERFKSLNKSSIFLPLSSKDDSGDKSIDGSKSLPGQVRRKKSLLDLLKVKHGSSRASKDGDEDDEKVSRSSMIGTLGRKTLDRLTGKTGKDSKKDSASKRVPIQSLFEPPPPRAEGSTTQGEDSDEELSNVMRDELKKVVEQQGFLQRVMKKKPAVRMFCFNSAAADSRVELLDVFRYWKKIGVVIVQDDKKGLVMRAELSNNDMELKPCSIVGEIRVVTGDRKKGTSVARFTLEKGAVFSFTYLCDELFTSLNRRGIVIRNPKEVSEMVKVFDN
ncbi:hypothetical protein BZA77DRAFT_312337 [Pyronema omphalodes]|nr:hypothetical protein BZA77DRAFT_312337 [Pyronema omphalodes]